MRSIFKGLVAAAALLAAPAQADVVSDWAELQTAIDKASGDPMAGFDPLTAQAASQLSLAMFEAANSVDRRYASHLKLPRAAGGASDVAAVSAAARDVLLKLYPSQTGKIESAFALAMMEVKPGPSREAGLVAGRAAALAALAAGGIDPALPKGRYRPTAPVGLWSASGVPFPSELAAVRPWFMTKASQFRLPPPPALTSPQFTASFNETKAIGAKTSSVRTADQTLNAKFWIDYGVDPLLRQVASAQGRSLVRNARFYALMAMAIDDFTLVMVDGKMNYMYWRPLNAIRTADADGNDATIVDPDWEPLVRTPQQPEYPCGHCSFAAVVATIAAAEGPAPTGGYRFVSDNLGGVSRSFRSLEDYISAVNDSRIQAGVHWRMTTDASVPAAKALARLAMTKFAPPIR